MGRKVELQDIFTSTYNFIYQQGPSAHLSSSGVIQCDYRSKDGKRCAAGYWIKDEDYRPEFEGRAIGSVDPDLMKYVPTDDWVFMTRLQIAHDEAAGGGLDSLDKFRERYRERMQEIAYDYKLRMPA